MEIKDILDLSYQWFDGFFTLWALYITLTGAILAYIGTAVKGTSDTVIRFILLLSFLMFAYVNWSALDSVGKQREALSNMGALIINDNTCKEFLSQESLNSCKESIKTILNQGKPFKSWQLTSFHVSIDILVLFAIWFVPGELARLDFSKALSNSKLSKLDDGQEINWGSNDIEVSYIASKKEWKLSNDYSFEIFFSQKKYSFMIPSSFYYDLSSVPRLFWWLVAPFELTMVGPLVHDFIYRNRGNSSLFSVNNNHQQISRSEADDIFNFIMQKEGIHPVRRIIAYYAVRLFGWLSW